MDWMARKTWERRVNWRIRRGVVAFDFGPSWPFCRPVCPGWSLRSQWTLISDPANATCDVVDRFVHQQRWRRARIRRFCCLWRAEEVPERSGRAAAWCRHPQTPDDVVLSKNWAAKGLLAIPVDVARPAGSVATAGIATVSAVSTQAECWFDCFLAELNPALEEEPVLRLVATCDWAGCTC